MRFSPGNAGRPAESIERRVTRRQFRQVAREILDEKFVQTCVSILNGRNQPARVQVLRLLAEYGFGKPMALNAHLHAGAAGLSPEAVLLQIAGEEVPAGLLPTGGDDEDDFDG